MYTVKGFIKFHRMALNTPGQTATLGELAAIGMTYSKEIGEYSHAEYADPLLLAFHSKEDDTMVEVPVAQANLILEISQWLFDQATSGTLPTDPGQFVPAFNGHFDQYAIDIDIGEMATNAQGVTLPTWISYRDARRDDDNTVTLWFANEAFLSQYDEYELVFINPITPLDNFFHAAPQVKVYLDAITTQDVTQRINQAGGSNPYTQLRTDMFRWHDRNNRNNTQPVYWTTLIYGPAGNNLDIIKQAWVTHILDQSEFDRDAWAKVFPDLFTNTEFILAPLWSQYAIPNKAIQSGMYSPVVTPKKTLNLFKTTIRGQGYSKAHIEDNWQIVPLAYKSLSMAVVGCQDNRDGIVDFYGKFTDYLDLSTSSTDFGRMSRTTQNWVLMLMNLLKVAEETSPTTRVPTGVSRVVRDDVMYVAQSFDNVQYLVVTAYTMEQRQAPHVNNNPTQGRHTSV